MDLPPRLVSSDLNGTLVHQHTMSDMIRIYIGQEEFKKANVVFKQQTSGLASMEEAFGTAGPLTKGLTLRQAIRYTIDEMRYISGFSEFVDFLHSNGIPLVINSTGYSVTIYAIMAQIGTDKIHGQIGNILHFGVDADPEQVLSEEELEQKVREYLSSSDIADNSLYDSVQATGEITLGIINEDAKAELIQEYVQKHFPSLKSEQIVHMGDTMGDSGGILGVAKIEGTGIAFNFNSPLREFLEEAMSSQDIAGQIHFVDPKGDSSDLQHLIPIIQKLL